MWVPICQGLWTSTNQWELMSPINLTASLLMYAFVGVWRLSQDLLQPPFNQPNYVRHRKIAWMLVVASLWPIVMLRYGRSGGQRVLYFLAASRDEFTFKTTFKHKFSVPTTTIKSLTPFVSLPFWAWGILIEHNFPGRVSPIYLCTTGRPSKIIKQLVTLPFNSGVQIDLSSRKGSFPC